MPDLPHHPDTPDRPDQPTASTPGRSRAVYAWWAAGLALVALFVVLHLTGVVGPAEH